MQLRQVEIISKEMDKYTDRAFDARTWLVCVLK